MQEEQYRALKKTQYPLFKQYLRDEKVFLSPK